MKIFSKIVLILLFPAAILLWPIGWSLFWIGSQKSRSQKTQTEVY